MTKSLILKQLSLLAICLFLGLSARAQVKVGNNPTIKDSNAIFEMESTKKGMLLPRLALTSTTAFTPLTVHVRGMVVYNTANTGDVTEGFYYNDGLKWVRIAGSPSSTGSGNLTNGNGIIVTGGTGATLVNTSLRIDSSAIAKMVGQVPVRDSIISTVNNQITVGNVTGQNLTSTSGGALIVTGGSGTSLKSTN